MKIFEKPAATIAGTTSARLTSTSRATAVFEERNSRSSSRKPCGLLPDRLNSAVGSMASATPVKARSSSTMSVRRRPIAGIVDIDVAAVDPFQHHEMVEVPVDDAGHRQFVQRRRLLAETLGVEAEGARRPDDVAGLAAVARDAAGNAKLLQRNPRAVMREHHRQRGRAALDGFHLQDGRRLLDVPAPEQPSEPVPQRWRPDRRRSRLLRWGVIHRCRSTS